MTQDRSIPYASRGLALRALAVVALAVSTGEAAEGFVVAREGRAAAVIQVEAGRCPPVVRFAAEELRDYLGKITGGAFRIQRGVGPVEGKGRIVLGDCAEARKVGIDPAAVPRDGFVIRQVGDALYVCGRDDAKAPLRSVLWVSARCHQRGTLLGVYHLLRETCGVRWVLPGSQGECVPRRPTLVLPKLSLREAPVMRMRIASPMRGADTQALFGKRTREVTGLFHCRQGWSSWRMAKSHYFAYEYSASRWVKAHPEYFAVGRDGRRVLRHIPKQGWWMDFTNPGLAREVALDAIAYFQGKPASARGLPERQFQHFGFERESLAINAGDTPIWSYNPACRKYRDADGDYSELAWLYYGRVSAAVAKACPGKLLSVWSYADYRKTPKSLPRAPENCRLYIVNSGPFDWTVDRFRRREMKRLREWYEWGGRKKLYVWANFNIRACRRNLVGGIPSPMPVLVGEWVKDIAPYVDGVYFSNVSDVDIFEASNTCAFFRMAWDPSRDPEAVAADYYATAYGPAAQPIRAIETEFERLWRTRIATPNLDLGPRFLSVKAGLPTRMEVWQDIYTDAVASRIQAHMARALEAARGTPFAPRVEVFRDHYLGAFLKARETFVKRLRLGEDMRLCAARAREAVRVDGRLDEGDWGRAEVGTMFRLQSPDPPSVKTGVRALFDAENLYVAIECGEPEMTRLRAAVRKRDDTSIWKDDDVEIMLDPGRTRRDFYQIMLNSAGTMADLAYRSRRHDTAWSSGARLAVAKGARAWTVEIAVPFSKLGVDPPKAGDTWAAAFCRSRALTDPKPGERQLLVWSRLATKSFNNPAEFGRLVFTEDGRDPQEAHNLLRNGSFEARRLRSWGGKNVRLDASRAWRGSKSVLLERTRTDEPSAVLQRLPERIRPNREYVLTYFMRVEDIKPEPGRENNRLAGVGAEIHFKDRGWTPCPHRSVRGTGGWRKYVSWVRVGPRKCPTAAVRFQIRWATGKAWIDDVQVREVKAGEGGAR